MRHPSQPEDPSSAAQVRQALAESLEEAKRLRLALEGAELGTWRHDLRTGVIRLDERARRHYGVDRHELLVEEILARVWPDDRERLAQEMAETLGAPGRESHKSEYRAIGLDGSAVHLEVGVRVEFEGAGRERRPVIGYGTTRDVTQARLTERQVLDQALLLQQVERIARIGGWDFDVETQRWRWTAETQRIHGLESMPDLASSGLERFGGQARATMSAALDEALRSGTPYDLELPFTAADGRPKWVRASCRPVLENGRVVRLTGTLQDITDRKESELALRRFMQSSPTIVYVLAVEREQQRLLRLEGDIERLTGYRREDVDAGDWWLRNIHPDDLDRVLRNNPAPYDLDHLTIEFRFRRADGRYMWVRDERRLLRGTDGQPAEVVGSWSDVSERVELELKLRQSQKLEAIGQLAGGIAHDFNNLLTVILGTADELADETRGDELLTPLVEDIRLSGERAALLTQQLLAFSRKQVLQPAPVDVNESIASLERMLARLIGEHIAVRSDLQPGVGHVVVDPGQFQQVLLNLAVNARDAMPKGGDLRLSTRLVSSAELVHADDIAPGSYVRITVEDNGQGMSPEVVSRVFEPFFTTKPVGRGTGLGLATVFGIVKQSGGHVTVESTEGVGTRFAIYLPSAGPGSSPPTAAPARSGHERIMLVDDEEAVRRVAARMLSRQGYRVVEAATPHHALALAQAGEPIDLLVTDVVMPGLSGPELARKLQTLCPDLKVLFVSGYVDAALEQFIDEGVPHAVLPKPFSPSELTSSVRRVLDDE